MSKTTHFRYPDDPIAECVEFTRAEFLEAFPREPIRIWSSGGKVSEIPLGADEIICDFCSADPGDAIFLIYGTKGICRECAARTVFPYVVEVGAQ